MFIQVGRIRIIGAENLKPQGRVIFCPNHSSMFDAPVIFSVMKRYPRYMTAYEEMRGLAGLKAVVMGAFGCFAVDRSRGKTVLEPAINVLLQGDPLVIFPEGKISGTGEYLPFKKGSALIAIGACEKLGPHGKGGHRSDSHLLPWTRRCNREWPHGAMGFKWRKGATVTVGKPIWIHDLDPLTPENVTDQVRIAITEQTCPTTSLPSAR